MKDQTYLTIKEILRANIDSHELTEVFATGCLLIYLDKSPTYSSKANIEILLKAEAKAKEVFEKTLEQIEKDIPYFKNMFKNFSSIEKLQSTTITRLFYELSRLIEHKRVDEIFDEGLEHFILAQGSSGSEFITPESINCLAISILDPKHGSFYDGVFGYGGSLLKALRYSMQRDGNLKIYGQEINNKAWAIGKIRLFISGNEMNDLRLGNVLVNPQFKEGTQLQQFDYVFMDAPFSKTLHFYDQLKEDPYNQFYYGLPNRSNGDFAFLSHALALMNEKGRGIFLTSHGTLFRGGKEKQIRNNMILSDVIEAIISLPSGFYNHTSIPVSMVVLNKSKSRKDEILFVDVGQFINEEDRFKQLSKEAIKQITNIVNNGKEISEVSKLVHKDQLEDSNLNVKRYVLPKKLSIEGYGKVLFNIEEYEKNKTIPLRELATFFRGYNISSKDKEIEDGPFPIVRLSNVDNGRIDLKKITRYKLPPNARTSKYELKKNDVILSIRGQTLKVAVVPVEKENLLLSQNFIGIRCMKELDPYFLKMFLESPLGQYLLTSRMSGTAIPTLSRKDVESLNVPFLPINKQRKIISSYINKEKEILQQIEELKEELKQEKIDLYREMGIKDSFTLK